ncbi:hypothetical protein AMS68_004602 [Peltaster fructicola]|uniref:C2H2-type domain-containing protein n=1 Tax=Peltaster fructicola TaxID=286661 RepID=A0A6H0XWP9_9PEZI|nr:hypothetical protein AMS68_004602 [Peltaster fructicola]
MSFFPDSEMHKLHSQQYYNAPPTPEYGHESPYSGTMPASGQPRSLDPSPAEWETQKNHGLGLLPAKPFGPMTTSSFHPQAGTPTSFAWSAFVPAQTHTQNIPEFRREMWVDTPASNVSSGSMWSALPLSTVELESSEMFDHSDYSTTSCTASGYSSPYTTSTLLEDSHAPFIKLESPFDANHSPGNIHYEQPAVVNPQDIVTCAPPATPQVVFTPLLTPLTPMPTESQSTSPQPIKHELEDESYEPEKVRRKRGYTTPEDATCSCKQCGKLFRRASNLAAHMQTHEAHRDHPWACRYDQCDKRFNRRTDMERHARSVHIKDMSHRCQACYRCFGRKDTLSRHELAGCPRRKHINPRNSKKRVVLAFAKHPSRQSLSSRRWGHLRIIIPLMLSTAELMPWTWFDTIL